MEIYDVAVFRIVNGLAERWALLDGAGRLLTWAGYAGAVWLAIALLLIARNQRRLGFSLILVLGATGLLDTLIKLVVARPRPPLALEDVRLLLPVPDSFSFLSGHALTSFAAATLLALAWRGRAEKRAVLALAVAIAWSRVHVGHHYPSDVLAGALLGALIGWLAWLSLRMRVSVTVSKDA